MAWSVEFYRYLLCSWLWVWVFSDNNHICGCWVVSQNNSEVKAPCIKMKLEDDLAKQLDMMLQYDEVPGLGQMRWWIWEKFWTSYWVSNWGTPGKVWGWYLKNWQIARMERDQMDIWVKGRFIFIWWYMTKIQDWGYFVEHWRILSLGSGCVGLLGWSLGFSAVSLLEIINVVNKGFKYRTLVIMTLGWWMCHLWAALKVLEVGGIWEWYLLSDGGKG